MKRAHTLVLAAGLLTGATTNAQTTFFASSGTTLYRTTTAGAVESFDLGVEMIGMAVTPNGQIYVQEDLDGVGAAGISRLWRLDNGFTANPTLTLLTDTLTNHHPTISATDNETLYGFKNGSGGRVSRIDLTPVIDDNTVAFNTVLGSVGGSAYDRNTGTFWVLDNDVSVQVPTATNSLYTIDDLSPPNITDEIPSTLVGGLNVSSVSNGMEFYQGTLYVAIQNGTSGDYEIGTLNTSNGQYTFLKTLVPGGAERTDTALAVLPAPGTGMLLGMGLLAATRRRR